MIVDPNENINSKVEHVLIENGSVNLYDGSSVSAEELAAGGTAFHRFCASLDPNLCFIDAFVISNEDEPLLFSVMDEARKLGVHCQAGRNREEVLRRSWDFYLFQKQHDASGAGVEKNQP